MSKKDQQRITRPATAGAFVRGPDGVSRPAGVPAPARRAPRPRRAPAPRDEGRTATPPAPDEE